MPPSEPHRTARIGWLRAAVLGANDGIISTSSLMVGVAAASSSRRDIVVAGVAGLVAGALSMAAGEYVSVSSQADTERAEIDRERRELADYPAFELQELTDIYVARGLGPALAADVAKELMAKDALGAHARDELGLSDVLSARPVQAAAGVRGQFRRWCRAALAAAVLAPSSASAAIAGASLDLTVWVGRVVGSDWRRATLFAATRVTFWGALAMGLTAGVGWIFGLGGLAAEALRREGGSASRQRGCVFWVGAGLMPAWVFRYLPYSSTPRKCDATREPSTFEQACRSRSQSRIAWSNVSRMPGISRYSPRTLLIKASSLTVLKSIPCTDGAACYPVSPLIAGTFQCLVATCAERVAEHSHDDVALGIADYEVVLDQSIFERRRHTPAPRSVSRGSR